MNDSTVNNGPSSNGPSSNGPVYRRSSWMLMIVLPVALLLSTGLLLSGCGQSQATAGHPGNQSAGHAADAATADAAATAGEAAAHETALPHGVMTAAQACRLVVGRAGKGFVTGPEQVHLVLTSYAQGEPAESQGDISGGMPAQTLVWVVEVHAKAVNWDHSTPAAAGPGGSVRTPSAAPPDTDFSVVMNAKTGYVSDQGECRCWPLPLGKVGALVSLPPTC
jgi:hypothetical protein